MKLGFQCQRGGYNNNQPQFGPGCIYRCHCVADAQCDNDTGTCPGGCAEGWMGPGCQYGDIALRKATWQSSNTGSDKAVDGNPSTCSETNQMGEKWWMVDLNGLYRITGLAIFSNSPDTLKGFEVRVGNVSSTSKADFRSICFNDSDNENVSEITQVLCTSELIGKNLMITIMDQQTKLILCDVRVYGGRSLAYRRFANQSRDAYPSSVASKAVDGGTNTLFTEGSCTHTPDEISPRWMVDLEQVYTISRIEILNRKDCCAERLKGFSISFAINSNFVMVYKYPNKAPGILTEVTNMSSDTARFIQIELTDTLWGALTLCEVFIYGDCPENLCGWSCEYPCFCANLVDKRNKIDGYCPGSCAGNWTGSKCNLCYIDQGDVCVNICGKCRQGTLCNASDATCVDGCQPGWWNLSCRSECNHCNKNTSCTQLEGICSECAVGKWGPNCQHTCIDCGVATGCNISSGICLEGCRLGRFGVNCDKPCGHCGGDRSCDRDSGRCNNGCLPGWMNYNCTIECPSGWFGVNCSKECGHCANNSSCDRFNGTCIDGCSPGYTNSTCEKVCPSGFYGLHCNRSCYHCADGSSCHHINGACLNGCNLGYIEPMCDTECPKGYYGYNCSEKCGSCYNHTVCEHIKGDCSMGCEPDFTGSSCKEGQGSSASEDKLPFVGGGVGVAVVFLLIVIGLVMWRIRHLSSANRHQRGRPETRKMTSDNTLNTYETVTSSTQGTTMNVRLPQGAYENVHGIFASTEKQPKTKQKSEISGDCEPIHFSPCLDNVRFISSDQPSGIIHYQDFGVYYNLEEKRIRVDNLEDYVRKTVYLSTDCEQEYQGLVSGPQMEMNVALKLENRAKSRYKGIYAYDNTRVVLDLLPDEPDSDYINACFIDQKCYQYWPSEGSLQFGTLLVEIVDEEIYVDYTTRSLKVTKVKYTIQSDFYITGWEKILRQSHAGIGRTGTYLALDYLYSEGQATGSICVFDCINNMRRQRVGMVQTAGQYVYLHEALVEALLISGKRVDGNDFPDYYQQMREIDETKRRTRLWVEYESLRKDEQLLDKATPLTSKNPVYEKAYEFECGRRPENKMKNRYGNIMPCKSDSLYILTLKNKHGLILTQVPLPDTVVDLWTLAFEYEVETLVMLNEEEMPGEKIGTYWPKENQIAQFGPFTVTRVSETRMGTHVQRMLHVAREGKDSALSVKQFACSLWKTGNAIPESCSQFLSFLEEVESWQRQSNNGTVIVHCLNGAEKSGLFCVLWCVLERIKDDREVAIRSVVRQISVRRQQIIPSFEQYQFCHDIVLEYLTNYNKFGSA
ncbi:hypothetical protein ACJMK2_030630 [Sinanodonta woodiana]|uniref:Uncharacterized protein n=1 Tax=Sinanodonta woodiana TaxID=1069815 RepID=A0ABD3WXM7_SINWO